MKDERAERNTIFSNFHEKISTDEKTFYSCTLYCCRCSTSHIPASSKAQVPFWEGVNQAYNTSGTGTSIREMASDPEGGILVTGRNNGDIEFPDGDAGFGNSKDGFLVKVNADGSFAWSEGQGKRANDTQCFSVDTDENSNVYVSGDFEYTAYIGGDEVTATGNSFDGFMVAYDKDGNKRWKKIIRSNNYTWELGMVRAGGNSVVSAGYFDTEVNFGGGQTLESHRGQSVSGRLRHVQHFPMEKRPGHATTADRLSGS